MCLIFATLCETEKLYKNVNNVIFVNMGQLLALSFVIKIFIYIK